MVGPAGRQPLTSMEHTMLEMYHPQKDTFYLNDEDELCVIPTKDIAPEDRSDSWIDQLKGVFLSESGTKIGKVLLTNEEALEHLSKKNIFFYVRGRDNQVTEPELLKKIQDLAQGVRSEAADALILAMRQEPPMAPKKTSK